MLRVKRTSDAHLIDDLDRTCFPADERLSDASLYDADWWIAVDSSGAVGYCGVLCGSLIRYGVLPGARAAGVGGRLVKAALKAYAKMGLPVDTYVMATNVSSLRCLLRCGFVITHATTDEYATYLHLAYGPKSKIEA